MSLVIYDPWLGDTSDRLEPIVDREHFPVPVNVSSAQRLSPTDIRKKSHPHTKLAIQGSIDSLFLYNSSGINSCEPMRCGMLWDICVIFPQPCISRGAFSELTKGIHQYSLR
jgi:hypothetical protein